MLGALLIFAALTDKGDAAGRGLAQIYALGFAIALLAFGAIVGLSTFFRSKIGLLLSIVIMATPPILYLVGVAKRFVVGW